MPLNGFTNTNVIHKTCFDSMDQPLARRNDDVSAKAADDVDSAKMMMSHTIIDVDYVAEAMQCAPSSNISAPFKLGNTSLAAQHINVAISFGSKKVPLSRY